MGWYEELKAKAEEERENAPKTIDELRQSRAQAYSDRHAQEVQAMLDGVSRGIELRKQRELEQKQFEESEKAKELERLKDIKEHGSNDTNDKARRDAYRNLIKGIPESADRTAEILS